MNLWIESARVCLASGDLDRRPLPSGSGRGQELHACTSCGGTIFTRYLVSPGETCFVRAGTLDDPSVAPPDVHIFTRSMVPWLSLPAEARVFESFYDLKSVWPATSLARLRSTRS